MGLTYVDATVTGPTDKSRQIQLLVDSGASYSLLPEDVWQELEIKPQEKLEFILADGTKIERRASECKIRLMSFGVSKPASVNWNHRLHGYGWQQPAWDEVATRCSDAR